MKILLLTQVLPFPPDSGPKVKTWNILKYLARHHDVTLISFIRGDKSEEIRHLQQYCHRVHTTRMDRGLLRDLWALLISFLNTKPFLMVRDDRPKMKRMVDSITEATKFDIIYADQLNMAQYVLRVSGPRRVLDTHNALWLLYERLWKTMGVGIKKWILGRERHLLKSYEGQICKEFEVVTAVSEEDKSALEEAIGEPWDIHVIPISVDPDELLLVDRNARADHILHIGTMYWPPNIDGILWFLREVWPIVQTERPDIQLDLVGANPPTEIVSFAKNNGGVNVTGYVVDPEPFLKRAGVMIIPLRAGGGMRVKILNSFAWGIPLVSTSLGCEGISVQAGRHLLIADTPNDFAKSILDLLEDRTKADELRRAGRELVESKYNYQVVCKRLENLLMRAVEDEIGTEVESKLAAANTASNPSKVH